MLAKIDYRDIYKSGFVTSATLKRGLALVRDDLCVARAFLSLIDAIAVTPALNPHCRYSFDKFVAIPSWEMKRLLPTLDNLCLDGEKLTMTKLFKIIDRPIRIGGREIENPNPSIRRTGYSGMKGFCRLYSNQSTLHTRGFRIDSFWQGIALVLPEQRILSLKLPKCNPYMEGVTHSMLINLKREHSLDDVSSFISSSVIRDDNRKLSRSALYRLYREQGGSQGKRDFFNEMANRGFETVTVRGDVKYVECRLR